MILQKGGWSIVHYSVFFFHHLQYQYEEKGPEIPQFLLLFFFCFFFFLKTNEMIYRKEQSL